MITLDSQERDQLVQTVEGKKPGSYMAAQLLLKLSEGRDKAFISKTLFCTMDEIDRIEKAFEQGGVEAAMQLKM